VVFLRTVEWNISENHGRCKDPFEMWGGTIKLAYKLTIKPFMITTADHPRVFRVEKECFLKIINILLVLNVF
jgi:hypothetical protein